MKIKNLLSNLFFLNQKITKAKNKNTIHANTSDILPSLIKLPIEIGLANKNKKNTLAFNEDIFSFLERDNMAKKDDKSISIKEIKVETCTFLNTKLIGYVKKTQPGL